MVVALAAIIPSESEVAQSPLEGYAESVARNVGYHIAERSLAKEALLDMRCVRSRHRGIRLEAH
ncbi:MAG: hypothetical protein ACKPKO_36965, partial [Candidatus Fonsibacter sp.]